MSLLRGPNIDNLMSLFYEAEHQPGGVFPWWIYAARQAFLFDHCYFIPNRNDPDLYLGRFWVTKPVEVSCREHDTQCKYTSRGSVLLHLICGPDDDAAVHSHPWAFDSEVLSGGFTEREPGPEWEVYRRDPLETPHVGPYPHEEVQVIRKSGDVYHSPADRMHRITLVEPNTWTLVRTADTADNTSWGFHPPGKPFIHWRDFLNARK